MRNRNCAFRRSTVRLSPRTAAGLHGLSVRRRTAARTRPMKDHPLTPMRESNLLRLLQPQVDGGLGLRIAMSVRAGAGAALRPHRGAARRRLRACDRRCGRERRSARYRPGFAGHAAAPAVAPPSRPACRRSPASARPPPRDALRRQRGPAIVLGQLLEPYERTGRGLSRRRRPGFMLDPLASPGEAPERPSTGLPRQRRAAGADLRDGGTGRRQAATGEARRRARRMHWSRRSLAVCARAARARRAALVVAGGETSGAVIKALGLTAAHRRPDRAGVPGVSPGPRRQRPRRGHRAEVG